MESNRLSIGFVSAILTAFLSVGAAPASGETRQDVSLQTTEGEIVIRLYDETPLHSDNFLRIVEEGVLDSLLFHRVIKNFMIQAGDPDSRHAAPGDALGEGDLGYKIPAEFRTPEIYHKRGAVAMARDGDDTNPEKASSACQFYIVWGNTFSSADLKEIQARIDTMTNWTVKLTPEMTDTYRKVGGSPHLDGSYTVFGEVIKGLDVVERIQRADTDDYDRPIEDIRIIKATTIRREQDGQ